MIVCECHTKQDAPSALDVIVEGRICNCCQFILNACRFKTSFALGINKGKAALPKPPPIIMRNGFKNNSIHGNDLS